MISLSIHDAVIKRLEFIGLSTHIRFIVPSKSMMQLKYWNYRESWKCYLMGICKIKPLQ